MTKRKNYNSVQRHRLNAITKISSIYTQWKMKFLDIKFGTRNRFIGIPFIKVDDTAGLTIGNKNRFRSLTCSNEIGLNHRCMLTVVSTRKGTPAKLTIGNGCGFSGTSIVCCSEITIGNNVRVGANSLIMDGDGHYDDERTSPPKPIIIEDNVFVGANCIVKKGVRIGKNSVIGMNSVVTQDIPENCIATGIPARPIAQICNTQAGETVHVKNKEELQKDETLHIQIGKLLKEHYPNVPLHEEKLIDNHHIDSMTQMSIVATLSEHFGIEISFEHITPENFNSHKDITLLIQRLQKEKQKDGEEISISIKQEEKADENPVLNLSEAMRDTTSIQLIMEQARTHADTLALVMEGTEVSYGQLGSYIYTYSQKLKECGIKEGDYVMIHALCSEHYLAVLYAVHLIGAVAVPLEKAVGAGRVREIAEDVQAKLIIAGNELLAELKQNELPFESMSLDAFVSLTAASSIPFDELQYPKMETPCLVLFTTGSTGKSKGVEVSHRAFSWSLYAALKKCRIREHTIQVTAFPLNHLAGLYCVTRNLNAGLTTIVFDGIKDIQRFFDFFEKYQVNYIGVAPSALKTLVQVGKKKLMELSSQVYGIACGSEPLPLATMQAYREVFPNAQLQNILGSSETGYICSADCDGTAAEVPLGTAMEGVTIGLRDEEGNIHTENDCTGLICVKTPMLMEGYFNLPELTATVVKDGWFVMSDLAYKDKNGVLFHRGRADDVIIVAGFKVSPLEVEGEALNSGLVSECVCTSRKDRNGTVSLCLIVVPLQPETFDPQELKSYLTGHLETYRVPQSIETTDALKRTFNGKLDRKAYREA